MCRGRVSHRRRATRAALAAIDHAPTRHEVEVERAFLAELGSGCSLPVGGHASAGMLWTFLADLDTGVSVPTRSNCPADAADLEVARTAAQLHRALRVRRAPP